MNVLFSPCVFCMLLILCIIAVERMNETMAALYNITDFSLGELLLLYFTSQPSLSVKPSPAFTSRA